MDDLYSEVVPKHEPGAPAEFTTQVQTAAEHLLAVVDGKPKEVFGSNYTHIKEVIGKVHESGYFDQSNIENNTEVSNVHLRSFQTTKFGYTLKKNLLAWYSWSNIGRVEYALVPFCITIRTTFF